MFSWMSFCKEELFRQKLEQVFMNENKRSACALLIDDYSDHKTTDVSESISIRTSVFADLLRKNEQEQLKQPIWAFVKS